MAHRLESIALGACRRLSRNPSSLRCGLTRPQQITSSRIRPATATITNQHRNFHVTTIKQDDLPPVPKIDLENLAPFTSPKVEALFKKMMWLDMIEIHLLAEMINEKMGITISDAEHARMARGGGGGGGKKGEAAEEEVVVEKTAFDLKLTGFDAKSKIKVIKEVRAMTSLGLKEAKELVESAPTTVKKDIKKEEAEELMAKLVALGATVEIV